MTNRNEKVANHNKNSGSFFKLEKQNNLLNYQFNLWITKQSYNEKYILNC